MSVSKVTVLMDSAGFFAGSFLMHHIPACGFAVCDMQSEDRKHRARRQLSPLPELGVTPRKGFRIYRV